MPFIKICERRASIQRQHVLRTAAHHTSSWYSATSTPAATGATTGDASSTGDKTTTRQKPTVPSLHLQSTAKDCNSIAGQIQQTMQSPEQNITEPIPGEHKPEGKRELGNTLQVAGKNLKPKCAFHPQMKSHYTNQCGNAKEMTSVDLDKFIIENQLCDLCFNGNHKKSECRSTIGCSERDCPDPKGHNKLIHSSRVKKPHIALTKTPNPSTGPATHQQEVHILSSSDLDFPPTCKSDDDLLTTQLGLNTIRPCHNAFLKGSNGLFPIQIMYDIGGDLSQITTEMAEKCTSKPFNSLPNLPMNVAGGG